MAIEQNYLKKLQEIEQARESLTDFEVKFIFGDEQGRPMKEREGLSDKQKAMIDRIYKERVQELDREAASVIEFGNNRIAAVQTDGSKAYRVTIDNVQVGPIINFGEATNVVSWISTSLNEAHVEVTVPAAKGGGDNEPASFPGEED
jgi:hypothetical protein